MLPSDAIENRPDIGFSASVFAGDGGLTLSSCVLTTHLSDIISGESGFVMLLPVNLPTLGDHVSHVLGICSWREVRREATRWIVATVKYLHSIRDRANIDFVCDTVCSTGVKLPVPIPVSGTFPFPAEITTWAWGQMALEPLTPRYSYWIFGGSSSPLPCVVRITQTLSVVGTTAPLDSATLHPVIIGGVI